MNKIPKEISIAGVAYKIIITDDPLMDASGCVFPGEGLIYISTKQSKEQQYAAYIHEVIEVLNLSYDLGLEHHYIILLETALIGLGIKFTEGVK